MALPDQPSGDPLGTIASPATIKGYHRWGIISVALAAVFWSTSGFFVRLISVDLMTLLFWRGIFSGTALFVLFFMLKEYRGASVLRKLNWSAVGVMVVSAFGMICGIVRCVSPRWQRQWSFTPPCLS